MLLPVHTVSIRAQNVLFHLGIKTAEGLRAYWTKHGPEGMLKAPNCGRKTVNEIAELIDMRDPATPITRAEYERAKMVVAIYEEQNPDNSPIPL